MVRLIVSAFFLIILSIIIALNAGYTTAFNLFGLKFNSIPTIVVSIISFVGGILFSYVIYFSNYFKQKFSKNLKQKKVDLKEFENKLKQNEKSQKTQSKDDKVPEKENIKHSKRLKKKSNEIL